MDGSGDQISVRRLGWAGLEIELGGEIVLVDPFEDASALEPFVGPPRTALPAPSRPGAARAVMVTHLHSDHTDPSSIARALRPDGAVLRPEASTGGDLEAAGLAVAEGGLAETGVTQRAMSPWETFEAGPFMLTAVPAVDGFGDPQVSWVIEGGGRRLFHGGDTILHGWWWSVAMRCGPIDVAFLPVNGPVVSLPHRQPSNPFPSAMDPAQAAVAARALGARLAVPIHYDTFHSPPTYVQVERPAERFAEEAERLGVSAVVVEAGEGVELP